MNEEIYNELENLNSSLAKYQKQDIYSADEDYFENIQNSVLNQIKMEKSTGKTVKLSLFKKVAGIAAGIILIVIAIAFFKNNTTPGTRAQIVSVEEITGYLNLYIEDIDDTDFASVLSDYELSGDIEPVLNTGEIEEYLEYNIDDISEEELEQIF